jgi:hypothetical protein
LPFGALRWAFFLGFWLFALRGSLPLNIGKKLLLWAFWCGKLLEEKRIIEGKIAERKRIVESKMLKGKGKNC